MRNTSSGRFLDRSNPPSMFTLILLASVSALTMTIYLPSLPAIASELNSSTGIIGLSVGIYLASSAVVQLIVGESLFGWDPIKNIQNSINSLGQSNFIGIATLLVLYSVFKKQ